MSIRSDKTLVSLPRLPPQIISFVAAGLSSTGYFCYAAIVSASIVLILPGWPTCVSALELQSRSIVSGSVRLVYAVVYSLFLGFGISLGANIWVLVSGQDVFTSNDNTCSLSHRPGVWWQETIPQWFFFLVRCAARNGSHADRERRTDRLHRAPPHLHPHPGRTWFPTRPGSTKWSSLEQGAHGHDSDRRCRLEREPMVDLWIPVRVSTVPTAPARLAVTLTEPDSRFIHTVVVLISAPLSVH